LNQQLAHLTFASFRSKVQRRSIIYVKCVQIRAKLYELL
jgi:hypothetical protein